MKSAMVDRNNRKCRKACTLWHPELTSLSVCMAGRRRLKRLLTLSACDCNKHYRESLKTANLQQHWTVNDWLARVPYRCRK